MKVLFFKFKRFSYTHKDELFSYDNGIVAFTQMESLDEEKEIEVLRKYLKIIKWFCGKFNKKKLILHSFAHLSEDRSKIEFAQKIFNDAEERLKNSGYEVCQTPFGAVIPFEISMDEDPLARFFRSI